MATKNLVTSATAAGTYTAQAVGGESARFTASLVGTYARLSLWGNQSESSPYRIATLELAGNVVKSTADFDLKYDSYFVEVEEVNGSVTAGVLTAEGGAVQAVPNFVGGFRVQPNDGMTTGQSGLRTCTLKYEASAPFTAVRVWYGHKSISGTPPTVAALVAATETAQQDSVANAYTPRVGGTYYNALATTDYGWRRVKWAGADSKQATLAIGTAGNCASYMCSDWLSVSSVPRADNPDARPLVMIKVANTDATGNVTVGMASTYNSGRGLSWFREVQQGTTSNNGVDTITNLPTAVVDVIGGAMYCWPEFMYDRPVRSAVIVGSSSMASAYNPQSTSWALRALSDLNTPDNPIDVMNFAGSGHSQVQYMTLLDVAIDAGMRPTDIVLLGWSQNGFGQNYDGALTVIGRMSQYLEKYRQLGIRVWMCTGYAVNGYSGVGERARVQCVNAIRNWGAQGLCNVIDIDEIISDYTNPTAAIIKPEYNAGDNVHVNDAGQKAMEDALKAAWSN